MKYLTHDEIGVLTNALDALFRYEQRLSGDLGEQPTADYADSHLMIALCGVIRLHLGIVKDVGRKPSKRYPATASASPKRKGK